MARGKIAEPFTVPAAFGALTVWGVYPCPLSFELSFSTVPRQFPQDLLGVPSEFVLLSGSSRVQVRGSDPSRLPPPSGCPTAPAGSAAAAPLCGSNIHELQPVKTLGGIPF